MEYPTDKLKKEWVQVGITDETIKWAESFGKFLSDRPDRNDRNARGSLTTSQLRRFFGEIRRIENNFKEHQTDFQMLKPMLAYAVGRDKNDRGYNKTKIAEFNDEISKAIDYTLSANNQAEAFKNFIKIFEAIVAYHKFHGGK